MKNFCMSCLTLTLLLTACGGGGSGPSPAPPAIQTQELAPFDAALVKNWPGLPNVGMSCFMNTSIKLLAAMPEMDPFLAANPGDGAKVKAVRSSLREVISFIRSGAPQGRDVRTLVQAVLAAFREHPQLRQYVAGVGDTGGYSDALLRSILSVLGSADEFKIRSVRKEINPHRSPRPAYGAETITALNIAQDPALGGFDLAPINSVGEFLHRLTSGPGTFDLGGGGTLTTHIHPTHIPRNVLLDVAHLNPTKALQLSDQAEVPVYAVDQARQSETRTREVHLQAAAASIFRGGHLWAVIRGDDGWYANDDSRPSRLVDRSEMDEQPDGRGGVARSINLILFKHD
jgi:hypothetical protein